MVFDPALLAQWGEGEWSRLPSAGIRGFSNDTRTLGSGEMFVALKTEKRDGGDFLNEAKAKGAAAALVSEWREEADIVQLRVGDPLRALQDIAAAYRESFDIPVVGITGSCGKTTTKDLLACLLGGDDLALSTLENQNNLLGVPLTLLRVDAMHHRFAVIEAGISEKGEMAQLARMVQPDYALITSIGESHLEGLGSVENVAAEKGLLAQGEEVRTVFIDATASCFPTFWGEASRIVAKKNSKEVGGYHWEALGASSVLHLRLAGGVASFPFCGAGEGLASNVALALLASFELGVDTETARSRLQHWRPQEMRGAWKDLSGKRLYIDCYNANPLSMRDALETFAKAADASRSRLYIIGCMEELGEAAVALHVELGKSMPFSPGDKICLVGSQAKDVINGLRISGFDTSNVEVDRTIEDMRMMVDDFNGDVFVKGSRRYRLEQVMPELSSDARKERAAC